MNKVRPRDEDAGRNKHLSDWLHSLPVGSLVVVFFGCASLSAGVIYVVIVEFPTSLCALEHSPRVCCLQWAHSLHFSSCSLLPRSGLIMIKRPLSLIEKRAHSEM